MVCLVVSLIVVQDADIVSICARATDPDLSVALIYDQVLYYVLCLVSLLLLNLVGRIYLLDWTGRRWFTNTAKQQ